VIVSPVVLAGIALLLAAVHLYGALAHHVGWQRHEQGVRLAVGALRSSVLALVLKRRGLLAGLGPTIGAAAAVPGSRLVRGLLFDMRPDDPATDAGAARWAGRNPRT
jgi:ABC-type antimicrobial peptide transport system permease subunit